MAGFRTDRHAYTTTTYDEEMEMATVHVATALDQDGEWHVLAAYAVRADASRFVDALDWNKFPTRVVTALDVRVPVTS